MLNWLYRFDLVILYPTVAFLVGGASVLGHGIGLRYRQKVPNAPDLGTLTGAALGLLALLLAFSFSIALSRYDARRTMVLEEANAIGSTANFALMLPKPSQQPILALLRDYASVRIALGVPYDPVRMEQEIEQSLDLQARLWQHAMTVTAADPQSLPAYRFVSSLNEMNNVHERRITALRYHVPVAVTVTLMSVAFVGMAFAGFNTGVTGARLLLPNLIMSVTVAVLIAMVIDLDSPNQGLIQVPKQPLIDAALGIPR